MSGAAAATLDDGALDAGGLAEAASALAEALDELATCEAIGGEDFAHPNAAMLMTTKPRSNRFTSSA